MQTGDYFIGMMSGTSLDAVDAVLVDFSPEPVSPLTLGLRTCAYSSQPIPPELRQELLALHTPGHNELHRAQLASLQLGHLYVETIGALLRQVPDIPRTSIQAAGIHGQTIRHCPDEGYTLQLNAPAWIAERTHLNIISDFRSRDIAAGGQGAPLVPAFHAALLGCQTASPPVVLNLGGIANVSILQNDAIQGWDCGPANMLLDAWCQRHTQQLFDSEGRWAESGRCLPDLLQAFLQDAYFKRPPPKSTGRDYFNLTWLDSYCQRFAPGAAPQDIQATLLCLTARSIARDIAYLQPQAIWIGGGGAFNTALLNELRNVLKESGCLTSVESIAALGIHPCHLEAIAFAWLARQHCKGLPGNLPSITGASTARCLGSFTPAF